MDQYNIDGARAALANVDPTALSAAQQITYDTQRNRLGNQTGGLDKTRNEVDPELVRQQADQLEKVVDLLPLLPGVPPELPEKLQQLLAKLRGAETIDEDLAVELQEILEQLQKIMQS